MESVKSVVIAIQARSGSSRFPRKAFELIDGKPVLRHVIDAADRCAFYMNRHTFRSKIQVSYAVLCPYKDEIKHTFNSRAMVIEGPEDDVLLRYRIAMERLKADYVVRITGDCPLIPPYLITKHIKVAVANGYDYCSNVDENCRTAIDGHDVEVMSRRALEWADENAKDPAQREHVTLALRQGGLPEDFKIGHVLGHLDQSHIKLSIDTPDDLERVRVEYERAKRMHANAEQMNGRNNAHLV